MPASPTTKWSLVARASSDAISTIAAGEQAFLGLIDGYLSPWSSGTLASRPAAGKAGRRYLATDVGSFGCEYVDNGTLWKPTSDTVKLAEITLGAAGKIDFTSIPQGFKSLRVVGQVDSARTVAATSVSIGMRVNNDSGASYHSALTVTTTNTVPPPTTAPGQSVNGNIGIVGYQNPNAPASPSSGFEILIPRYSVTGLKTWVSHNTQPASGIGVVVTQGGGHYFGSTAAITRLTFSDDAPDNLINGATIALYGIV